MKDNNKVQEYSYLLHTLILSPSWSIDINYAQLVTKNKKRSYPSNSRWYDIESLFNETLRKKFITAKKQILNC